MCLRSQGLINKGSEDKDCDSDDKDIRKDKAFGRAEPDEVIISSQLQELQEQIDRLYSMLVQKV